MSTIRFSDLFRYYKALPHQMAAIVELEEQLLKQVPDLFNKDQPWFKTWSQAGKQPDPIYLAPALRIIKEFEGCHLVAYACPAGVWTIGWGNTQIDGRPVRQGDKISQVAADTMLRDSVERFAAQLYTLIPSAKNYGGNQQAALLSWLYNVGSGAADESTLRRRLNAGESAQVVIPQELPKWDKANGKPLLGLTRRRAAEVALFVGAKPVQAQQQPAKLSPSSPFTARITPHISLGEFALGQDARRFDHQHQVNTAAELAAFMERCRARFGGKPVIITSGYRPAAINRSVGGASGSEHLYNAPGVGAVDFYIQGESVKVVQDWCDKEWPYSLGYGAPKGFVHLGIRSGRPRVRWDY
jgi:GH24 family phage-related lysozyme (muramidase)